MLVVMSPSATPEQVQAVAARVRQLGYAAHIIPGAHRTAIGVTGNRGLEGQDVLRLLPGVADVLRVSTPYKLVSRETHPDPSVFTVATTQIGGGCTIIGGPCAVENERMILESAEFLMMSGVKLMRGGAYKPRTSPYAFQGLGAEGLRMLGQARQRTGIGIVTEVLDVENVERVAEVADVLQIGTRSMQNYPLLRRVAQTGRPVLLKRGLAATLEEWLMAAEHILSAHNPQVILCERGIRSIANHTRNTLDLSAIPAIKKLSHLPIIVDPSHATGKAEYVPAMCLAALAAGADGLLVEVHPAPAQAVSDGAQSLTFEEFTRTYNLLKAIAAALDVRLM